MRSALSTKFVRVMGELRGMIVGARDVRREKNVGVRLPRENGVEGRGCACVVELSACSRSVPTAVAGDATKRGSGVVERSAVPRFSCISAAISAVLAVLRFAPGWLPTTVPYVDPRRRAYSQYSGQSSRIVRPDLRTSLKYALQRFSCCCTSSQKSRISSAPSRWRNKLRLCREMKERGERKTTHIGVG